MKVALIQTNADRDKEANVARALTALEQAVAAERPQFAVLPEAFPMLGGTVEQRRAGAEPIPDGPLYRRLADTARRLGIVLHAGSLFETAGDHVYNTSVVFDADGRELARYRKIHLFDVTLADGTVYRESELVLPGTEIVTYRALDRTIGCSICYDLRFPELFHRLRTKGAEVIVLPSAFTLMTGKDHWEVLVRARAIETQCYVLACNQVGRFDGGRKANWGHSMVVDPWGHVLAQARDEPCGVVATLDFDWQTAVRGRLPVHRHHRLIDFDHTKSG